MHAPVVMLQQGPVTGQVLGVHVPPIFQSFAAGLHSERTRRLQTPVTKLQQRPGKVQGLGEQVPPADHVLPVRQRA